MSQDGGIVLSDGQINVLLLHQSHVGADLVEPGDGSVEVTRTSGELSRRLGAPVDLVPFLDDIPTAHLDWSAP